MLSFHSFVFNDFVSSVIIMEKDKFAGNLYCRGLIKTHCGLVTPYGNIDLGQYWLR